MRFSHRFLCLLVSLLIGIPGTAAQERNRKTGPLRPNVLLITVDTVRADHIGAYGYSKAQTPNIDSVARDGIRFARAYATNPTTLPSHSTILTGTYPMLHGMHDFSGNRLSPNQPTLATMLKKQGYSTGAVIGAAVLDSRFGLDNGFDYYYDDFDFSRLAETNLDAMERPGNIVADKALEWLSRNSQRPFLLWIHLYDPHHPYTPPAPYDRQFATAPYDGEIAFADAQIGRVLRFLKDKGAYNKTLIAISGDHGEGLGEHGEKTHGFFIYNSTMQVPLILKPPIPAPVIYTTTTSSRAKATASKLTKVVQQPVSLVDLLPTILQLTGVPYGSFIQGRSLMHLMDTSAAASPASAAYSETYLPRLHFNWSELRGLHREQYHFIDGPKPELYDLANDPREINNLFAAKPALSAELRGGLASVIRENTPQAELAEKTSLDPAMAERLKALGYAAVASGATMTLSNKDLPDPKDRIRVYELIASGIEDSQHGRYDASVAKLKTVLETEPDSVPVHYLLALNYYRKHDFAGAQQQLSRVLELNPDYSLAAYYLGLSYVGSADWDNAITAFQRALKLDPTNHAAAYNLGAVFVQKQMLPEAIESLKNAVMVYPAYAQAWRSLADLYLYQGDAEGAIRALEEAARSEPRDPRIYTSLARAYQAKGLILQAEAATRKAEQLRNGPKD
jgi:arylsulfatase A-like enzyme/Tfp pilus assembly protein PilF